MRFPLGQAPSVLLVEDENVTREGLAGVLAARGYRVSQAINGARAWKCMTEQTPDAVVLDMELPVMDGFELLRRMRVHATLRKVYVIVASGLGGPRDRELAFEAGCNELIVKPYTLESMAAALESYFIRHGSVTR